MVQVAPLGIRCCYILDFMLTFYLCTFTQKSPGILCKTYLLHIPVIKKVSLLVELVLLFNLIHICVVL